MSFWFGVSCIGFLVAIPLNFFSVEHKKLEKRYGLERGKKIGEVLGYISGWGLFGSWIGIWISPQLRLYNPFSLTPIVWFPFLDLVITLEHLVISSPLILIGMYLGIRGVQDLGLKVAQWMIEHMQSKAGYFYYRQYPLLKARTPMLHWAQTTTYKALALLLTKVRS